MNVAALVTYDGTRFAGFQRQASDKGPTVQGTIEAALAQISGEAMRIEGAGRTDSGVHATGQVVNFHAPARLAERLDAAAWQRALNALLPADIAVTAARSVDDDFRARWCALSRSYRYTLLVAPIRAPLHERYAWRVPQRLDVAAMDTAAALLRGEHDFAAFGSSPHDRRDEGFRGHTVRTMLAAHCGEQQAQRATADEATLAFVECCFSANAFLSGMVRRIVGTLALVGAGTLSLDAFAAILEARDKAHLGAAAPAHGLCLTGVAYPPDLLNWHTRESR